MAKPISPRAFREEAERRLIDTHELMLALGLRSKPSVWARVDAGKLPQPVFNSANNIALWDRDDIELPDTKEAVA